MKYESIGLAELINQVKRELAQPLDLDDPTPTLAVEEIDLEIGITVSKKAEGGVRIHVVELGAGGERVDVHTVRVKLLPLLTREQLLDELQKSPDWQKVVQHQMTETLKGVKTTTRPQDRLK